MEIREAATEIACMVTTGCAAVPLIEAVIQKVAATCVADLQVENEQLRDRLAIQFQRLGPLFGDGDTNAVSGHDNV